ncbi:pre-mRNA-splicing factor ATP-dependent RNA helicase DEAH1-like protein isoform X1 [Tanacetum coccineum]
MKAVEDYQVLVVVGESGVGKTTQIPQYLHEAGNSKAGKIGCTQPRETASICAAERVSHEMGATLGLEVGYSTQSQDCTSPGTLVKYMTNRMLIHELLHEPDSFSYSVLMVEDAHETLLSTQILLSILKGIASSCPEFKLLITSAAWEARKISDYFDFAPVFKIPGRIFPVEINYTKKPNPDYLENAVDTVLMIHVSQPRGDGGILVFLPGYEEIKAAERILIKRTRGGLGSRVAELLVCPLYEDLPPNFNSKIFESTRNGARKVVLATSIVETLVAINGIKYVIDTGFVQRKAYHPHTGLESLVITHISKASAYLRARQAGQTGSGKCFSLGFHDLKNFDFIDPPRVDALEKAQELLLALGALNTDGALTLVGKKMIEFPLGPLLSRMIVASDKYKCSEEIITIAAMLSIGASVFCNPKVNENNARFYQGDDGGDHIALLEVCEEYEACSRHKRAVGGATEKRYFPNLAKIHENGSYLSVKHRESVCIHSSSGLAKVLPKWVVYHEIVTTAKTCDATENHLFCVLKIGQECVLTLIRNGSFQPEPVLTGPIRFAHPATSKCGNERV